MRAQLIDGKKISQYVRQTVAAQVETLKEASKRVPGLAVILLGSNPASQVYVANR